ncbi:MAG TPA: hypothetical protein VNG33_21115 [Polyangiaceae bacterium]|nr:hypothetical protein [Polyangiaceae bacterium]
MIFAFGLFACALLASLLLRRRAPELHERLRRSAGVTPGADAAECSWAWLLGGFALLTLAFGVLESIEPFYFTQDDVLVGELPRTLTGCRQLWSGVWPSYDPFTLLGSPLGDVGLYSLTYPPTWVSYGVARHLLGSEYLASEVFAILHLALAYFATLRLARLAGAADGLAVLASLSFVLSGSVLLMGRSWHMVLPTFVFLPLLLAEVQALARGPASLASVVRFGALAGLFFHVGFPQMWLYSLLFSGLSLVILVASGHVPWRRAVSFSPALLLAAGIAMPLLLPQLELSSGVQRIGGYGNGIADGVLAMLLPWPLVSLPHPNGWGSSHVERMGLFYFYGGLFAWLAPLLPALALSSQRARRQLGRYQWLILGVLSFALALGPALPLWPLISKLPVFRTINNNPFRLLPFVVLFTCISGASFLESAWPTLSSGRAGKRPVFALGMLPVAWLVGNALPAFYSYGFRPYPKLPAALAALAQNQGRVLGVTPLRSEAPDFYAALPRNLASVYGLAGFDGYDPVVESLPPFRNAARALHLQPAEALRRYGVHYMLVHGAPDKRTLLPNPVVKEVARDGAVSLFEISHSDPLAFSEARPEQPLLLDLSHGALRVTPQADGGAVILNFLHYERMTGLADGKTLSLDHDRWGRIRAVVPRGTRELLVRYRPRWLEGLGLGCVLGLLAMAGWLPLRRFGLNR